jgi:hypothetical protein
MACDAQSDLWYDYTIIAVAVGSERAQRFLRRAARERILAVIPAVVIVETTRGGGRDASANRVIGHGGTSRTNDQSDG